MTALAGRRPRGSAVTRSRVPATDHDRLAAALTPRDRWILRMLAEHRVLTTPMLVGLAFPSPRSAQLRLRTLFDLGVLNRFQPLLHRGSAPLHWVIDTPGHAVLAAEDAADRAIESTPHGRHGVGVGQRSRRAHTLAIAQSRQLTHLLQVNSALTTLAATTGISDGIPDGAVVRRAISAAGEVEIESVGLTMWWSQTRAARHVGDFVRPDAYLHYRLPGRNPGPAGDRSGEVRGGGLSGGLAFFYEHDRGSESATTIAAKIANYHDLARATSITTPVLFWLPTRAWEATVRDALHDALTALPAPARVPIATTSPATPAARPKTLAAATASPPAELAGPVWLPLADQPPTHPPGAAPGSGGRVSLARLALRWPHQPGRDHTTSPLTTPLGRPGRSSGPDRDPSDHDGGAFTAPHPQPPPATGHPARP